MKVTDRNHKLEHYFGCLFLFEAFAVRENDVEKLTASAELGDDIVFFAVFEGFVELEYIWMVQTFQNIYLSSSTILLFLSNLGATEDFHSSFLSRLFLNAFTNLHTATLVYDLFDVVVISYIGNDIRLFLRVIIQHVFFGEGNIAKGKFLRVQ